MATSAPSHAAAARGRLLVLAVPHGDHVVVLVAGDVDLATAFVLRDRLGDCLAYRPRSVVVDATDLTFCDLSGLDALVHFANTAERAGVTVTIHPSPRLAELVAAVRQGDPDSGQPDHDPSGCPLPRPSRQTA